jgi:4-hydroxybenzoate polyprenyltransferase
MNLRVALRLGRVSNLPTVWTNVLTGVVLAGVGFRALDLLILMLAGSSFYVGGMYLNDAFDAEIDRFERPERPIPSGQVTARTVFVLGFAMLLGGIGLLALIAVVLQGGKGWPTIGAGLILALMVVVYDGYHKANLFSPVVMGICRILLYVMAALALHPVFTVELALACVVLLTYVTGLAYVAKQENLRRLRIPRVVGGLIAGISLIDALLIGMHGGGVLVLLAFAGFGGTLLLQRYIPGT